MVRTRLFPWANSETAAKGTPTAEAKCCTRDWKNSWPVLPAVPSTMARRVSRSLPAASDGVWTSGGRLALRKDGLAGRGSDSSLVIRYLSKTRPSPPHDYYMGTEKAPDRYTARRRAAAIFRARYNYGKCPFSSENQPRCDWAKVAIEFASLPASLPRLANSFLVVMACIRASCVRKKIEFASLPDFWRGRAGSKILGNGSSADSPPFCRGDRESPPMTRRDCSGCRRCGRSTRAASRSPFTARWRCRCFLLAPP